MASLEGERAPASAREDALRAEVVLLRGAVAALRTARRSAPAEPPPEKVIRVVPLAWVIVSVLGILAAVAGVGSYVVALCVP